MQYYENEEVPAEDLPESAIPKSEDEPADEGGEKKGKKSAKGKKTAVDGDKEKPKKTTKKVKVCIRPSAPFVLHRLLTCFRCGLQDEEEAKKEPVSKRKPASKRKVRHFCFPSSP